MVITGFITEEQCEHEKALPLSNSLAISPTRACTIPTQPPALTSLQHNQSLTPMSPQHPNRVPRGPSHALHDGVRPGAAAA